MASFLFDRAPLLLTLFLWIHINPIAFSFPPLAFAIQNLSSFLSSADFSSGFKISGRKRLDPLSFVLTETGTRQQSAVNWTGHLSKALHTTAVLSLLHFQPPIWFIQFAPNHRR